MKAEDRFYNVREGAVADVVQQCRNANGGLGLGRDIVLEPEFGDHPGREVKRTERVREPGMLGSLISKIGKSELSDTPQPLKLGCIDQRNDELTLVRICIDADYVMNRIAIDPF